jgi:hypothetical protein
MRFSVLASVIASASAAQWYGVAPDDTVPGLINLFQMTPEGVITNGTASIRTPDEEYVKSGTLHCSWNTSLCFFMTGTTRDYTQDNVYAVDRFSGETAWKHVLPAGIFSDSLVFDWTKDDLYYVAFNPQATPNAANIVKLNSETGAIVYVNDVARDVRGFVWGGDVTMCAQDQHLFIGVEVRTNGAASFDDYVLQYDVSGPAPRLMGGKPLLFPVPATLHAVCGQGLFATTIQADAFDREKVLIGDINAQGREGIFLPVVKGDLPTFTQRGDVPLFLNNLNAAFGGQVLIPVYPPFQRGPGPVAPFEFGLLWTVSPGSRTPGTLSPINYYLAGASGVPNA